MPRVIRKNKNYRVIHFSNGEYQVIGKRKGYWIPEGNRTSEREVALNLYRKLNRKRK